MTSAEAPWNAVTKDREDISAAAKILDTDRDGFTKVRKYVHCREKPTRD